MGYNYRATKNGEFLLVIADYETSITLGEIYLTNLKPFQRLSRDIVIAERD